MSRKKSESKNQILVSRKQVAEFFGVAPNTISHWKRQGLDAEVKRGVYDLKKVFDWWLGHRVVQDEDAKAKKDKWEAELKEARAQLEKLKLERERGELIPRAEIAKLWAARVHEVKTGLLSLVRKLPPRLEGLTKQEMAAVIEDEIYTLLERYARQGPYTPTPQKALKKRNARA